MREQEWRPGAQRVYAIEAYPTCVVEVYRLRPGALLPGYAWVLNDHASGVFRECEREFKHPARALQEALNSALGLEDEEPVDPELIATWKKALEGPE